LIKPLLFSDVKSTLKTTASMKKVLIVLLLSLFSFTAFDVIDFTCISLPAASYNYANILFPQDILNNITEMDNLPANNPITDAGATLGRVLFYDVAFSKNYTTSCASCHKQEFSFSDTARFSRGFNGGLTPRNSMNLNHARFQKDSAFFWDNRASSLEKQVLMPIQNAVEMGLSLDTLVARISAKSFYPPLFQAAFGSTIIDTTRIARALAQFIRSMNSFGSKYRTGVNTTNENPETTPFNNFTAEENLGKNLFMDITRGNCQACHTRNIFVQQGSKNIGLDLVYADNGVGAASGNVNKNGQFSVPSLINVELTAPYMHDGRFKTLEEVIDFYSDSVKAHPNLDGFLREILPGNPNPNNNPCNTCPPRRPHFSPEEKRALVAFLKTMTDTVITKDPRWSNPFCLSATTGITELQPVLALNIYPNPVRINNPVRIQLIGSSNQNCLISVYSNSGVVMMKKYHKLYPGETTVTLESNIQLPGLYIVQVEVNHKILSSKKIIAVL
jgi:cytochrome c peroxidase